MRSADRGFGAVDGDGAVDARGRWTVTVLKKILDVLDNQVNRHYNQPTSHQLFIHTDGRHLLLLSPHADRHAGDIYRLLFVILFVCLSFCPQDFGNGYLGRGWT